jgi:uncharacterized membrane protein
MRSRVQTILYSAAALLALIGLAEAIYLTVMNLTGETVLCGDSSDCFKVLGSAYSRIGRFPLAALGALAYFTVFSCAVYAAFGYYRARTLFVIVVTAMFLTTLWLLYVQAFLLHAFCRYCLFSAALIFILTAVVVLTPRSDSLERG